MLSSQGKSVVKVPKFEKLIVLLFAYITCVATYCLLCSDILLLGIKEEVMFPSLIDFLKL